MAIGVGLDAYPRYHIRRSSHRIYFPPGFADLDDSARFGVAAAAKRLAANAPLKVSVAAYSDDLEDGVYGAGLTLKRAATVVDAFGATGISQHRISKTSEDHRENSAPSAPEYCRQSYRRVGLAFSGTAGK